MNFNQQQQYGAPQPQQYSGYGAPASPTWQATAPTTQQPPQKQAAAMMMGGGNAPAPIPFDNGFAGAPPPAAAPTSPASHQHQQMPQDGRAPEFDPSSPGTPGQRMPTSPVQPQQQPSADPFGSINYGASPVSVTGGATAAAAPPAPLMQQNQAPPAMGLRQPSLGMNANQQRQQSNPFEQQPPATPSATAPTAAPTSPAPAPVPTSPAPQASNADPFASFGAVVAPAPTSPAPVPAPADDPWGISTYGQPPAPAAAAPAPVAPAPPAQAPPAPPAEAPPAPPAAPVQQQQQQQQQPEQWNQQPPQQIQYQQAPAPQQNQYQQPPAPQQLQQQQQQQQWNQQPPQQHNALVQATQPHQDQGYSNYNLGTGYPAAAAAAPSPPQQQQPAADPFGVFNQQPPAQQAPTPAPVAAAQQPPQQPQPHQAPDIAAQDSLDDFWGDFGANPPAAPAPAGAANAINEPGGFNAAPKPVAPLTYDENGLPSGGEIYTARVSVKRLGVLFFKATDLSKSLFATATPEALNALGKRACVGHVFAGSAAEAAGIGLGHILLKINGVECKGADEAAHLIKAAPRPLKLQCYSPPHDHCKPCVFEGKHMVKYDTKERYAPQSKWEWKPKYVVVGGVISTPLQMNMYRSKAEYDIAVKEVQSGETKVSVKVKQFSLYNSQLLLGRNGMPRAVEYHETWHYLVIIPVEGNPVKIAATTAERLVPVRDGIRRSIDEAEIQRRAVIEEEEAYRKAHPEYNNDRYDAYGGTNYYSQQPPQLQQQPQQQAMYNSTAPQQSPYDQGYHGGDYNDQGYAQSPPQQPQGNSATPWASY